MQAMLTCRFFLEPKCLVAGVGRVAPEVTYIKACILPDRALMIHQARCPRVQRSERKVRRAESADPYHAVGRLPILKGEAITYTPLVATRCRNKTSSRTLVPLDDVIQWAIEEVMNNLAGCPDKQLDAWKQVEEAIREDHDKVLSCARVAIFHRCQLHKMLVSSELSSRSLEREGKSEASSYCLVRTVDELGNSQLKPCLISYFILMDWNLALPTSRTAVVSPIGYRTDEEECHAFGQTVFRFDPFVDVQRDEQEQVPVSSLVRPFILIKTPHGSNRCMWRLVQFQGKLLGNFEQCDFW
jgi:hypothetical protein